MHCWKIRRRNPSNHCVIYSPDTDAFLFLIFHYPSLPNTLRFRTRKVSNLRNISMGSCYKALGSCRANALLGFHIFTVCDQTECFMRKSKTFRWKNFMNVDNNMLKALWDLGKNCLLKPCVLSFS